MNIKLEIILKDSQYGFSDLLNGRGLNDETKKEILDLIREDVGFAFDQEIKVSKETQIDELMKFATWFYKNYLDMIDYEKLAKILVDKYINHINK